MKAAGGNGWRIAAGLVAWLGGALLAVAAPDDALAARTVILVNSRQPESVELGAFYATQRGIPTANLVALPLPEAESITWREFVDAVWQPLQDELLRRGWLEGAASGQLDAHGRRRTGITGHRLAFLVLCRGVPLRIHHDPTVVDAGAAAQLGAPFRTNQAAVDSELGLLAQSPGETLGFQPNPLFGSRAVAAVSASLVVKVARLDGPTAADARHLVSSALIAERQGLIGRTYVDLGGPHPDGDRWLRAAQQRLADLGFAGDVESEPTTLTDADRIDDAAGYFGWYAGAANGPFTREVGEFAPGAIALHIHSFSAATLRSSTAHWCGPLIARGAAATFGNVFEPYLQLSLRPDLLVERLAEGANLGDAACFATPALGWQGVVVGDPLYQPFQVPLAAQVAAWPRLPPRLAGAVAAREATRLARLGDAAGGRALLRRVAREAPSLALALETAKFEFAHGAPEAGVAALGLFTQLGEVRAADWPLVRVAAELVATHRGAGEALPFYRVLVAAPAPSRAARWRAVTAAGAAAEAAGDLTLTLEYARLAAELAPAPPAPPMSAEPERAPRG